MKSFGPYRPPPSSPTYPPTQVAANSKICDLNLLTNQCSTTTWLLLGAALQALLIALPIRPAYAIAPALLLLLFRLTETILISINLIPNTYLHGSIPYKLTARFPAQTQDKTIAVLLLTTRINHPLGILAPGIKAFSEHMESMNVELEADAARHGMLGHTFWLNACDRTSKCELLHLYYFRNAAAIHAFAHGPAHRAGWEWWGEAVRSGRFGGLRHVSIAHEIFEAPAGCWESVYINYPRAGLGAAAVPVLGADGTVREWAGMLVDASSGHLATHKGRMNATVGAVEDKDVMEELYAAQY